ncbi:Terminase-like family protein [Tsuneonella dongtanensis]|uniref:Terminase-like family protein n=1 Tax=Tsuneonella dongtanensis TaxID=692370 RepID=A0A1B2A8Y2_9SPHN|nr:phage terminase large subunit [Tsuneonella dongtanensis]ANY18627.1 Terminase-like family protein [Tsuneonella dongtanensis]
MTGFAAEDPQGLLTELCRNDFTAFMRRAWPWISGGELLMWNWHLDAIAYRLERIQHGETRRLLVNLPPRNAKSKTVSVAWVAWMLGIDPTLNFVCVSYSQELSNKMARDCRAIMESSWYREIFPGTVISKARSAAWDFETTRGGGRLATSVGGTLTGRGGDIIILDDVIKPEESFSDTVRESVNEWFRSTLASRLNDKMTGAIICVMQRLHEHDLSGMLIETGVWDHLSLPAIATRDETIMLARGGVHRRYAGDVLHPAREPLDVLLELKVAMGSLAFAAQYQQDPMPAKGNVFRANWLRVYPARQQSERYGQIVQSWDTAIKTGANNDFSVCVTARIVGKEVHILHVWRGRVEFPGLLRQAVALAQEWNPGTIIIEDKASGQQLLQALRSGHFPGVVDPIGRIPELDKRLRASGVSSMVEAGQLLLPSEAVWLDDFRRELLAFPNARHDDQVDALAQLLDWVRRQWVHVPPTNCGPMLVTFHDDGGIEVSGEDYGLFEQSWFPRKPFDPWGCA